MSAHNLLIMIHAAGGGVAFLSGIIVLFPSLRPNTRAIWLALFLIGITVLIFGLFAVVALDWPHIILSNKITFGSLCVLALYMAWRAYQAYRVFREHSPGSKPIFIDHIGFNLISLFDGLAIITSLDLGAPGWFVGLIAILGVAVGIWILQQVKKAEMRQTVHTW